MLPKSVRRSQIPQSQWDAWREKRRDVVRQAVSALEQLDTMSKLMDLSKVRMFVPQLVRLALEANGDMMKVSEISRACARMGYASSGCKDSTLNNAIRSLHAAGEIRRVSHGWFAIADREDRPPRREDVYSKRTYRATRSSSSSRARSSTSPPGGRPSQPSATSAPASRRRKRLLTPPPSSSTTPSVP